MGLYGKGGWDSYDGKGKGKKGKGKGKGDDKGKGKGKGYYGDDKGKGKGKGKSYNSWDSNDWNSSSNSWDNSNWSNQAMVQGLPGWPRRWATGEARPAALPTRVARATLAAAAPRVTAVVAIPVAAATSWSPRLPWSPQ